MISVLIPNWNGLRYLETGLASLQAQTYLEKEVILVDNGSTDGSAEWVRENYPEVHLLALPRNEGPAYAFNRGLEASKGEIIARLDADTECDPEWLGQVQSAFDHYPEAGFVASKVLEARDRTRFASAGDTLSVSGAASNRWQGDPVERHPTQEPEWVFGACTAASAYRRALLEAVGPFDEGFFIYYEDVDYSFRAQLLGFRCLYVPTAIAWHRGFGTISSHQRHCWAMSQSHRNQLLCLLKNLPTPLLRKYLGAILQAQLRGLASSFLHPGAGPPGPVLAGKLRALGTLPGLLRQRRTVQAQRQVSLEYLEQILEAPIPYEPAWRRMVQWMRRPGPGPRGTEDV